MDKRKEDLKKILGLEGQEPKRKWYKTKVNWGLWVLIGGFALFLLFQFVVRPLLGC